MPDYNTIADDLYRIHCYADTLATLCSVGSSAQAINPAALCQIFKDIAAVTDIAAAHLYETTGNIDTKAAVSNSAHNHYRTLAEAVTI